MDISEKFYFIIGMIIIDITILVPAIILNNQYVAEKYTDVNDYIIQKTINEKFGTGVFDVSNYEDKFNIKPK